MTGKRIDAAIWGSMPLDIQLKLLAHLPLPDLLSFQVVCKAWCKVIRNIKKVILHGDLYLARKMGEATVVRVYSGLHAGSLTLKLPSSMYCLNKAMACTSNGLVCFRHLRGLTLYNPISRQVIPIPRAPIEVNMVQYRPPACLALHVGEDHLGWHFTIVLVHGSRLLLYRSRSRAWQRTTLQLAAGEEFSYSLGGEVNHFHGMIDGSTLYFLTIYKATLAMSVRSMNVLDNVNGISQKLFTWTETELPQDCRTHEDGSTSFTGDLAVVKGDIFMGCMRRAGVKDYTVALLVYNKQGESWDVVSEMPLTEGFHSWRPEDENYVELWSSGDTLVFYNFKRRSTCLYNLTTKAWSPLDTELFDVCPLKYCPLQLSFATDE